MSGAGGSERECVAARRVLIDALEALGPHRKAVVLVGAQAIYLHAGDDDMAVAPYTTDGDLALDPRSLDDQPGLSSVMTAAGFALTICPGTWARAAGGAHIDLLVPASLAGAGRRGARLGAHGDDVARKATGLEAAVVDRALRRLVALDRRDGRSVEVAVAGPAALLVAKLHKIGERSRQPERLQDKDGLDVLRLLRCAEPQGLAVTLMGLASNDLAGEATRAARTLLEELFADRRGTGSQMAARACAGLEDEVTIALSCEVLAERLIEAWR